MGTRLEGRVAIVTGGGHGIGKAYCRALAREGARVVVAEIDPKAADETSALVWDEGSEALAVPTDVADEASTRAMAQATVERFGRIDVLVNNAAGSRPRHHRFTLSTPAVSIISLLFKRLSADSHPNSF